MRFGHISSLCAAAVLTTATLSNAALLVNGDFNTDADTNGAPDGWASWSYGNGWANYVTSPSDSFTKDGSPYVNAGSVWNGGGGWYQDVAATPGQSFTLSIDGRTEDWDNSIGYMRIIFRDAGGNTLNGSTDQETVANYEKLATWNTYTFADQVAPAGTTAVRVEFASYGGTSTFDNAVLTATPEPASIGLLAFSGLLLKRRRTAGV